jgi:hypothetical protein
MSVWCKRDMGAPNMNGAKQLYSCAIQLPINKHRNTGQMQVH